MDQSARICIFQHPQRPIRPFFHIANTIPHIPALCGLRAPMAVKENADERLRLHPAHKSITVPLRKCLCAVIEHQVARRNHRRPIDYGLRQIGLCAGSEWARRYSCAIGNQRPTIILALLDQVQFVAARGPAPLPTIRRWVKKPCRRVRTPLAQVSAGVRLGPVNCNCLRLSRSSRPRCHWEDRSEESSRHRSCRS